MAGVKWCSMWKGGEAAVNLLASLLSGTKMAFHPSESDVRIEGINILPLIGCNVYMKAFYWLRYNQKRVKAKDNGHLLVYPGQYLSKTGTILF